ncbi:MAG TPA: hypothetical protein VJJ76_01985 [archaeon]|nr:hypothetical protein [archaeon]
MSLEVPLHHKRKVGPFYVENVSSDGEVTYKHEFSHEPMFANRKASAFEKNRRHFSSVLTTTLEAIGYRYSESGHGLLTHLPLGFEVLHLGTVLINIEPYGLMVRPNERDAKYDPANPKQVLCYRTFLAVLEQFLEERHEDFFGEREKEIATSIN